MFSTLISANELSDLIDTEQSDLVILDCRFNLMDTGLGAKLYTENHIPNARYIDLDRELSAPVTPETGRHPLPGFESLAATFSEKGVSDRSQVVVYDDCGGAMASRCWWLLKLLGHKSVALLDGGFPAWIAAGSGVTATQPKIVPGDFSGTADTPMILPLDQVADFPQQGLLIDARTAERFRGEQEPIDLVAGHIPGALNRPLPDNLSANGCFKSAEQLRSEWQLLLKGTAAAQVVHYCGSGVTACHNLLAMEHAGLTGARIYPGSWSEWIRDPSRPVATIDEKTA